MRVGKRPSLNILVVDDEPIVRLIHSRLIAEAGHCVMQAKNGREALLLVKHNQFDVILMDVNMPGMNGLESTLRIREIGGGQSIYIVGVTGLNISEDICRTSGMDKRLIKPVTIEAIYEVLAEVKKNRTPFIKLQHLS